MNPTQDNLQKGTSTEMNPTNEQKECPRCKRMVNAKGAHSCCPATPTNEQTEELSPRQKQIIRKALGDFANKIRQEAISEDMGRRPATNGRVCRELIPETEALYELFE